MNKLSKSLMAGAIALLGMTAVYAHDEEARTRSSGQLEGVWITKVIIRDCVTGAAILGPFPGLISFQDGGTISEIGPALPNSTRSAGHGTWKRIGHSTFEEHLIFQRFDVTGIFLGTQVIHAKPIVARDGLTYNASGGTFELKDNHGSTIASGCSSATGIRFE